MKNQRTVVVVVSLLCAVWITLAGGEVQAGQFEPAMSTLEIRIPGLPAVALPGLPAGTATLSDDGFGGHTLQESSGIWATTGFGPGSALFTGVPFLTNLVVTVSNGSGTFASGFSEHNPVGGFGATPTICPGGCFGGSAPLVGQAVLLAIGGNVSLPIDLGVIGKIGPPFQGSLVFQDVTVTGAPFFTGAGVITSITTNVISVSGTTGVALTLAPTSQASIMTLTTLGGFLSTATPSAVVSTRRTVTVSGTNGLLSASHDGIVTLVSPLRVITGFQGSSPGVVTKTFVFTGVPEPGTLILLLAGAVGMVILGRQRL